LPCRLLLPAARIIPHVLPNSSDIAIITIGLQHRLQTKIEVPLSEICTNASLRILLEEKAAHSESTK